MNKQELLKLYDMDLEELISKAEKITNENFPLKQVNAGKTANTVLKAFITTQIYFATLY